MNEKRESKQFCADISSWETRKQYDDVAYGSFMLFAIFVVTPISGLSMKLATILISLFDNMKCSYNWKIIRWEVLKSLLISAVLFSLLFLGGLIVWGNCLPSAHVNSTIKKLSLLVGVPFCLSVYAIMAGFGNAFTYSGKHVAQEALESYIDTDHR